MEKLADVLKVFLEKYFLSTIVSVAVTIVIVAIRPNVFQIAEKTNEILYFVLVFCVVFLLVLLICKGFKIIRSIIQNSAAREEHNKYIENENRKALETLWAFVDKLSATDKQTLLDFLKSNNEPIQSSAYYFGDSIFLNDRIMCETVVDTVPEDFEVPIRTPKMDGHIVMPIEHHIAQIPVKKYRLKDDFFSLLKYSYQKYNRISHFEEATTNDKT